MFTIYNVFAEGVLVSLRCNNYPLPPEGRAGDGFSFFALQRDTSGAIRITFIVLVSLRCNKRQIMYSVGKLLF